MARGAAAFCCVGLTLSVALARAECPPGLAAAAAAYRETLAGEQRAIRDSSQESPQGVEETVQFSLADHACHRGPGQAYREFGEPECLPPKDDGKAMVRFPFELFFRKALTLESLLQEKWEPGSDGALQVEFEREGERWIPVARRELLPQLDGGEAKARNGTP